MVVALVGQCRRVKAAAPRRAAPVVLTSRAVRSLRTSHAVNSGSMAGWDGRCRNAAFAHEIHTTRRREGVRERERAACIEAAGPQQQSAHASKGREDSRTGFKAAHSRAMLNEAVAVAIPEPDRDPRLIACLSSLPNRP